MSLSEYADPIEAQAATPQLAAKLAGKMPAIPAHRVTGADILVGKPGAFKVRWARCTQSSILIPAHFISRSFSSRKATVLRCRPAQP
jgi:hypothetical protein